VRLQIKYNAETRGNSGQVWSWTRSDRISHECSRRGDQEASCQAWRSPSYVL